MAAKKPGAKDWRNRAIQDWNVSTVHAYLIEQHQERFGVPYYPFGSWIIEKRMIKGIIEQHGADIVKAFIDRSMETYTPSEMYPGISFGFMFKYKNNLLQRAIKDAQDLRKQSAMDALFKDETGGDDIDWI